MFGFFATATHCYVWCCMCAHPEMTFDSVQPNNVEINGPDKINSNYLTIRICIHAFIFLISGLY